MVLSTRPSGSGRRACFQVPGPPGRRLPDCVQDWTQSDYPEIRSPCFCGSPTNPLGSLPLPARVGVGSKAQGAQRQIGKITGVWDQAQHNVPGAHGKRGTGEDPKGRPCPTHRGPGRGGPLPQVRVLAEERPAVPAVGTQPGLGLVLALGVSMKGWVQTWFSSWRRSGGYRLAQDQCCPPAQTQQHPAKQRVVSDGDLEVASDGVWARRVLRMQTHSALGLETA